MKKHLSYIAFAALSLTSIAASAATGGVKVDTNGNPGVLSLGQICDSYSVGSQPIAVACELVADPGAGAPRACNTGTCTPFGSYARGDGLLQYCKDTSGNDAIVTCTTGAVPGPLRPGAVEEADPAAAQKN